MVGGRQEEETLPWVPCVTEPAPAASSKDLEALGPWDFLEPHHWSVGKLGFPLTSVVHKAHSLTTSNCVVFTKCIGHKAVFSKLDV